MSNPSPEPSAESLLLFDGVNPKPLPPTCRECMTVLDDEGRCHRCVRALMEAE